MDGRIIGTSNTSAGKLHEIVNHSETAVTYRVEFVGIGEVTFIVLPGASFSCVGLTDVVINVHIEHLATAGIRSLDN